MTRQDMEDWIKEGKARGATHVISVRDTFEMRDYPVYVTSESELANKLQGYATASMQRINEVINLNEN